MSAILALGSARARLNGGMLPPIALKKQFNLPLPGPGDLWMNRKSV